MSKHKKQEMAVTQQTRSYQESEEFIKALETQFAQIGMDAYSRASVRWEHHISGVQRVLTLLPRLEPFLGRPISQARVLDIGCATGSASIAFAWLGCRQVVGLDTEMGPLGLKLAKRRAQTQNLTAHFTQGDGCHLPYTSNSFDFCFCDWVIEHIPAPLSLLQELQRVLAPGGVLFISTNNRLWPKEAHAGLWLISWLPHNWAGRIAVWLGRWPDQESWDVWLLTYWQILSLAKAASLEILGTRKEVYPPSHRAFSTLVHLTARLGIPLNAFAPNLYLLARKPA